MRLLSEVRFAAFLTYSPQRATGEVADRARSVMYALKAARSDFLQKAVVALRTYPQAAELREFFTPIATLVPVPRSAPFKDESTLWPARVLCDYLVAEGFGESRLACLRRSAAVPKSSFSAKGQRPNAMTHYHSLEVGRGLQTPSRIIVVDDVVTRGCTLLAAVSRIQEAFPHAQVEAFALLRTLGYVDTLEKIVDPCVGTIRLQGNESKREP